MYAGQEKVGKDIDRRFKQANSISDATKAKKLALQKALYYLKLTKNNSK